MDRMMPGLGVGAVRINSDIVTWPTEVANARRVKFRPHAAQAIFIRSAMSRRAKCFRY